MFARAWKLQAHPRPGLRQSRARAQGEQSTWAKLSAIQANCGIETTLDACMMAASKMAAERRAANARARGSRGRLNAPVKRARCPSWVNMSAIGAPPRRRTLKSARDALFCGT